MGRPGARAPVNSMVTAGSWLIESVCMLRTMARSSTIRPVCGNSSDVSTPARPCRTKPKAEPTSGMVPWRTVLAENRSCPRTDGGNSWPCIARNFGLGSNRSMCDGPPDMNRKITRRARGATWNSARAPAGPVPPARSPP